MSLRDEVEDVLRSWDAYEIDRGNASLIDYDCHPTEHHVERARDRIEVLTRLNELFKRAEVEENRPVSDRLEADLAYLRALLGERLPLSHYVRLTQGCDANGWSSDYAAFRREGAVKALDALGISWGPETDRELREFEVPLNPTDAPDAIRSAATELEPTVRKLVDTSAPFTLTIETANVDAYWGYWLDGEGSTARLRLNMRHAAFTEVRARQFALHEVLGHALQCASLAEHCASGEVPWVRIMSVHAKQQVNAEGLAQALPLFVVPDDLALVARVRLDQYTQLVRAHIHVALNAGTSVEDCIRYARAQVPYWTSEDIGDLLTDRGVNPLLRSYLWAYSAGLDWFAALADASSTTIQEVLRAAYRKPLTPSDLARLWPTGPTFGGG